MRPRRPSGYLIGGAIPLAVGGALMAGAFGSWAQLAALCRDNHSCGGGWLAEPIMLGFGDSHVATGLGLLIAGAARWSPEVRSEPPRPARPEPGKPIDRERERDD